jgi:hypothetical protein
VIVGIVLLLGAAGLVAHATWKRRQLLARLRSTWGKVAPVTALDDDRVSEAWQELGASHTDRDALDERTWADLDLDRVLAAIDRTQTALGR